MVVKSENGSYMQSYFYMSINTDDELEALIYNNNPVFIHEYIHLLQDLILPYCIRNNMTVCSQLACINQYAINNKVLERPFNEWNDDCDTTMSQQEYTWGCNQFIDNVKHINSLKNDHFTVEDKINVYRYFLNTPHKKSDDYHEYQVGARDFLEYIAYRIENKYSEVNTDDFPYKTVDKLFDNFQLSFVPIEVRMCIVEYCLYNDNPFHFFYKMFIKQKLIEKNRSIFSSYYKCKDYLLSMLWRSKGNFNETIFTKSKRRLADFRRVLGNQFTHDQFKDVKRWVDEVSIYVENNLIGEFIFSELYNMDIQELDTNLKTITENIKVPLIFNNRKEYITMLPKEYDSQQFLMFLVTVKFIDYVVSTEDKCPIFNVCKMNSDLYKKECLTNPAFVMKSRGENLCLFALFLRSYGFEIDNFKIAKN